MVCKIKCMDCGESVKVGWFKVQFREVFIWRDDGSMGDLERFLYKHMGHALKFYRGR
jgi:hypothetical protein